MVDHFNLSPHSSEPPLCGAIARDPLPHSHTHTHTYTQYHSLWEAARPAMKQGHYRVKDAAAAAMVFLYMYVQVENLTHLPFLCKVFVLRQQLFRIQEQTPLSGCNFSFLLIEKKKI